MRVLKQGQRLPRKVWLEIFLSLETCKVRVSKLAWCKVTLLVAEGGKELNLNFPIQTMPGFPGRISRQDFVCALQRRTNPTLQFHNQHHQSCPSLI